MNKLLIILLAICLACTHAHYVKREAPTAAVTESYIDTFKKEISKIAGDVQNAFDPENIKKNFNDIVDKVSSVANSVKPKEGQ